MGSWALALGPKDQDANSIAKHSEKVEMGFVRLIIHAPKRFRGTLILCITKFEGLLLRGLISELKHSMGILPSWFTYPALASSA